MNEKGFEAVRALFEVLVGVILFSLWIQIWMPLINADGGLVQFLTDPANSVPNATLILAVLAIIPLLLIIKIIAGPFLALRQPRQQYYAEYQQPPPPQGPLW